MISSLLLAVAVTLPPAATGPIRYSGTRLVADTLAPEGTNVQSQGVRKLMERQFAHGYMAGVADATEGTVWCDPMTGPPHEIDIGIVWEMKELPRDQLKDRAARKFLTLLAKHFPCRRKDAKPCACGDCNS